MNSSQLINQTSGEYEYYTPLSIIAAARLAMGGIDLDPASSALANDRVRASGFFTELTDGLSQVWYGRVWMNHPFSRDGNPLWINKLLDEYHAGHITQACCLTYACTSEKWFRPLLDFPQCFLSPRTNFYLPDGTLKKGVSKGSVVTYLGDYEHSFARYFCQLGSVKMSFNGTPARREYGQVESTDSSEGQPSTVPAVQ